MCRIVNDIWMHIHLQVQATRAREVLSQWLLFNDARRRAAAASKFGSIKTDEQRAIHPPPIPHPLTNTTSTTTPCRHSLAHIPELDTCAQRKCKLRLQACTTPSLRCRILERIAPLSTPPFAPTSAPAEPTTVMERQRKRMRMRAGILRTQS